MKVVPFQLRLIDDLNTQIKINATSNKVTKHDWIVKAIQEKLERELVSQ